MKGSYLILSTTSAPDEAQTVRGEAVLTERVVYVVDDDPAVRSSLCWLIESVGLKALPFGSAAEFLEAFSPGTLGCLVLDVRLPGMSGLELQEHLLARNIEVPIIIISGHGEVSMAVRALKAGAVNFFEKPFSDQALLDEVQRTLDREQRTREQRARRDAIRARMARLTPREHEVMKLVVNGYANKQVASQLGLSEKTVEIHRSRVMEKTAAKSLANLVQMAIEAGDAVD